MEEKQCPNATTTTENKETLEHVKTSSVWNSILLVLMPIAIAGLMGAVGYLYMRVASLENALADHIQSTDALPEHAASHHAEYTLLRKWAATSADTHLHTDTARRKRAAISDQFFDELMAKQLEMLKKYCLSTTQICLPGAKGERGDHGPRGAAGAVGVRGSKGDLGPRGPTGVRGPKGDSGGGSGGGDGDGGGGGGGGTTVPMTTRKTITSARTGKKYCCGNEKYDPSWQVCCVFKFNRSMCTVKMGSGCAQYWEKSKD